MSDMDLPPLPQLPLLAKLPELKVSEGGFCSQETIDKTMDYIQDRQPALISYARYGFIENPMKFDLAQIYVVEYLKEEAPKRGFFPQTSLGRLDLFFELLRRIQYAEGEADIQIEGVHLEPREPLSNEIVVVGEEQGITRGMVQDAYLFMHRTCPSALYEAGEALRRRIMPGSEANGQFSKCLLTFIGETFPEKMTYSHENAQFRSALLGSIEQVLCVMTKQSKRV